MKNDDPVGNFTELMLADRHGTPEDRERGRERIRSMPYSQFLETEYWKIISLYVIRQGNNRCHYCGWWALDVHHKTYENHGAEHLHLEDLVPVCRGCHAIIHADGKLPERRYSAMTVTEKHEFDDETAKCMYLVRKKRMAGRRV